MREQNKPREWAVWYEHGGTCFDGPELKKKDKEIVLIDKKLLINAQKKIAKLESQINSYRNVLKDYFNGSAIVSYDHADTRAMHLEKLERCEYSGKKIGG